MRFVVILLGALALAGCASREHPVPLNSYQDVAAAQPATPQAPAAVDYRIGTTDVLRIDVFGEPDLSLRDLPVNPDGRIVMPMVGAVQAEGRTTAELAADIRGALNRYLREPQVAVNVTEFASRQVTVTGAVRAPGMFPAVRELTLMKALALGQGLNEGSQADEIMVFRTIEAQRYVARFDLRAIEAGQAADPTILPGDTVVVGLDNSRRLFNTSLSVLPIAAGIFLALLN